MKIAELFDHCNKYGIRMQRRDDKILALSESEKIPEFIKKGILEHEGTLLGIIRTPIADGSKTEKKNELDNNPPARTDCNKDSPKPDETILTVGEILRNTFSGISPAMTMELENLVEHNAIRAEACGFLTDEQDEEFDEIKKTFDIMELERLARAETQNPIQTGILRMYAMMPNGNAVQVVDIRHIPPGASHWKREGDKSWTPVLETDPPDGLSIAKM